MTGLLHRKYNIAVLEENTVKMGIIIDLIKSWFGKRVVVKSYSDSKKLIRAINMNDAQNHPIDVAVLGPDEIAEKCLIQRYNPKTAVIVCDDYDTFKRDAYKILR